MLPPPGLAYGPGNATGGGAGAGYGPGDGYGQRRPPMLPPPVLQSRPNRHIQLNPPDMTAFLAQLQETRRQPLRYGKFGEDLRGANGATGAPPPPPPGGGLNGAPPNYTPPNQGAQGGQQLANGLTLEQLQALYSRAGTLTSQDLGSEGAARAWLAAQGFGGLQGAVGQNIGDLGFQPNNTYLGGQTTGGGLNGYG